MGVKDRPAAPDVADVAPRPVENSREVETNLAKKSVFLARFEDLVERDAPLALDRLRSYFRFVSHDPARSAALARAVLEVVPPELLQAVLPTVASPTPAPAFAAAAAPAVQLPASPPFWWKDHKSDGASPLQFITEVYGPYFAHGWTRANLTHEGQDKQLYDALVYWLRTPANRKLVPAEQEAVFLSKKDRNNKQLAELGGKVSVKTVTDSREYTRLAAAAYRRSG